HQQRPARPRRGLVVGIIAGIVVALGLPLGGFAVFRLLSGGGTQPHDVLPANALAYFRIDLDPAGAEKVDAIRFLRTFPAFEKYTRITDERTDVRQLIFEQELMHSGGCPLDFADDVEPWLGERFGVAVMPATDRGQQPGLAVAVQVDDEQRARAGMRRVAACATRDEVGGGSRGGWAYLDGYLVVSETPGQARHWADAAARRPLADVAEFDRDLDRLGDPGFATVWASGEGLYQMWSTMLIGDPGPAGAQFDQLRAQTERLVTERFRSLALTFRFDDRYAELAMVVTGSGYRAAEGDAVADMALPESTAVAFGLANGDEYVEQHWQTLLGMANGGPFPGLTAFAPAPGAAMLEQMLGLRLPQDLKTLVGQSLTLALDGEHLDLAALKPRHDLSRLDLGARVRTDPAAFTDLVRRLQARGDRAGVPVDLVLRRTGDGAVVATSPRYATTLEEGGPLADSDVFRTAVAGSDEAESVLFVNFDVLEPQVAALMRRDGAPAEAVDNVARVEAVGLSARTFDGYTKGALRITVAD
ncbi:MAG: DUF3352 domain-containing protein, partial [Actinomycetota bacterium]|nr:DUF3352 domain-containing protein [Actinomycetota bacterium]